MNTITLKIDLYDYKQVENTSKLIAEKLQLSQTRIEEDLMTLTNLLENYRDKQQYQNKREQQIKIQVPTATITQCITFLKQEKLITKLNELIGRSGIIGEETNRILLFIIASSYKMPDT